MEFLEKDLEDIIINAPNDSLRDRGLNISGLKRRQITVGNYGRIDIVTAGGITDSNEIMITVYELKQREINWDAFHQLVRYMNGIKQYLGSRENKISYVVRGVIIGRTINDKSDFVYATNVFDNISIYTYQYTYHGIVFIQQYGYKLIEEGF